MGSETVQTPECSILPLNGTSISGSSGSPNLMTIPQTTAKRPQREEIGPVNSATQTFRIASK